MGQSSDQAQQPKTKQKTAPMESATLFACAVCSEKRISFSAPAAKSDRQDHKICCACNEKWQANIAKICACHQKQLQNHQIPPLRPKVTSQEILPLPRRCATVPSVPLFLYGPFLYLTALFYCSYSIYLACSITA